MDTFLVAVFEQQKTTISEQKQQFQSKNNSFLNNFKAKLSNHKQNSNELVNPEPSYLKSTSPNRSSSILSASSVVSLDTANTNNKNSNNDDNSNIKDIYHLANLSIGNVCF